LDHGPGMASLRVLGSEVNPSTTPPFLNDLMPTKAERRVGYTGT
jgi:hypothetical protein